MAVLRVGNNAVHHLSIISLVFINSAEDFAVPGGFYDSHRTKVARDEASQVQFIDPKMALFVACPEGNLQSLITCCMDQEVNPI